MSTSTCRARSNSKLIQSPKHQPTSTQTSDTSADAECASRQRRQPSSPAPAGGVTTRARRCADRAGARLLARHRAAAGPDGQTNAGRLASAAPRRLRELSDSRGALPNTHYTISVNIPLADNRPITLVRRNILPTASPTVGKDPPPSRRDHDEEGSEEREKKTNYVSKHRSSTYGGKKKKKKQMSR